MIIDTDTYIHTSCHDRYIARGACHADTSLPKRRNHCISDRHANRGQSPSATWRSSYCMKPPINRVISFFYFLSPFLKIQNLPKLFQEQRFRYSTGFLPVFTRIHASSFAFLLIKMSSASDSQNQSYSASLEGSTPSSSSSDSPQKHYCTPERGSKNFKKELSHISGSRKNPIPDDYRPSNEAQEKIDMVNVSHYQSHTRQPINREGKIIKVLNYDAWPAIRNILIDEYARPPSSMLPILVSSGEEDSDLSDDAGGDTSEYQPREEEIGSETESDASQGEAEPKKPTASLYEDDSFEPEISDVEYVTPSALRCEKDILRKENESDLDLAKRRKEARVLSCVILPTSLTAAKLKDHQQNSKLPTHIMCPEPHMRCYTFDYPELLGRVPRMVLSTALLRLGIAPHLHWFIRKLCDAYRVAPLQITPNGYRSIVGLYILYDILGFPKLTLEDVRYFFTLKHSGQDYGYFYFSLWPSHYNKGFKVNNPSNMGTWKSPYYYIYSVPRIRTAFNPKPEFLSQVNLQGQALENAQKVFELPEDMKDFRKLINTENLQRCGFLPRGGHCTPPREEKKSKKKSASRSKKSKPIPTDVEDLMDFPKPPPFANRARSAAALAKDLLGSKQKPKPPKTSTKVYGGPSRHSEASGSRLEKRKQPDGPPPKDSSAPPKALRKDKAVAFSIVGNTFAKLVEEHVVEEDLKTWSELEGSNIDFEMNTLVSQMCYLQLSRSDELQKQSALLKATKDENKNLQHSLTTLNEELASLRKDLKKKVDEAVENERFWKQANADLVDAANKKTQELSDSLRLATETLKDAKRDFEEQSVESEANADRAYAEGTVNFMKSFMEKIPNFDWTPFGPETVVYAAEMKAQLEEEAKLAKQSETTPVMEEAVADGEAKPASEDDEVRIVEDPVIVTDAA